MNALKTIGRISALFGIFFITFIAGSFLTSFLPSPPGRYIFTPANEIGVGGLLLLVSWYLASRRWPRSSDLFFAWITSQLVVALIVAFFTGFSSVLRFPSYFLSWLFDISRFITPPIAVGMIIGVTMRGRRKRNGQQSVPGYAAQGASSPEP